MTERITARKNPLLQQVRKLLSSRRERENTGLFVADGTKLLAEAVKWWPGLETVILSDGVEADLPAHVRVVTVPRDVMESISPMQTPQGALFLCRLPEKKDFIPRPGMILLDGIQDPGNLGTILRTADALQTPVALLEGCADPYAPKPLRAAMGSIYHLPVWQAKLEQELIKLKEQGYTLVCGHLKGGSELPKATDRMCLVIGNEGNGVSDGVAELCQKYTLPMYGFAESLNAAVAAGILIYELAKSMRE